MAIPTTGLVALYDADELTAADGSFLTTVPDTSGSGYTLYTVNAGGTLTHSAINGRKAYEVSDGGWRATKIDHPALDYSESELTVSVVLSSGEAEASSRVWPFIVSENGTASLFGFMESSPANGQWGVFLRGAATPQWASGDVDTRQWAVLTLVKNSTSITWYMNGTAINSVATTSLQSFSEINLGSLIGQYFSGQIAIAGVWLNGFDAETRAEWHTYVQDTYGITVSDYVNPVTSNFQRYTGSGWVDVDAQVIKSYIEEIFTSSGTFSVSVDVVADILLVGGGGSGGSDRGGGGGAGGVLLLESVELPAGNYPVVVGQGGAAQPTVGAMGAQGQDTTIHTFTAYGGGAGGGRTLDGGSGGSGGGGGSGTSSVTPVGGGSVLGQGNPGGTGMSAHAAGGGGVGQAGGNAGVITSGGIGGDGVELWGAWYGGGGGGGSTIAAEFGVGGAGGGGDGGGRYTVAAQPGAPNTGGGGGGGGFHNASNNGVSGAGGSGIVIIRYV